MTIPFGQPAPSPEDLRARPIGRTGAELVLCLREALLLVEWDAKAEVFSVIDTEGVRRMVLSTAGPVHSAIVFQALATMKRWQAPKLGEGFKWWPAERVPYGNTLFPVMARDWPLAIGQGTSGSDALRDLARIREAVEEKDSPRHR